MIIHITIVVNLMAKFLFFFTGIMSKRLNMCHKFFLMFFLNNHVKTDFIYYCYTGRERVIRDIAVTLNHSSFVFYCHPLNGNKQYIQFAKKKPFNRYVKDNSKNIAWLQVQKPGAVTEANEFYFSALQNILFISLIITPNSIQDNILNVIFPA